MLNRIVLVVIVIPVAIVLIAIGAQLPLSPTPGGEMA